MIVGLLQVALTAYVVGWVVTLFCLDVKHEREAPVEGRRLLAAVWPLWVPRYLKAKYRQRQLTDGW